MTAHGAYRSLYGTFWDDPDVQALSHLAYRVLTTLKGTLPAAGIGFVLDDLLASRCSCTEGELATAYAELERPKRADGDGHGWIVRERSVVWLVNGLKFEPSIRATDSKHRAHVAEWLAQFGGGRSPLRIVRAFQSHYPEWFKDEPVAAPTAEAAPQHRSPKPKTSMSRRSPKVGRNGSREDPSRGPVERAKQGSGEGSRLAQHNTTQDSTKQTTTTTTAGRDVGNAEPDVERDVDEGRRRIAYLTRCVVALNTGMHSNPATATSFCEVATTTQAGVVAWEEDGIDIDTVEREIASACANFRPRNGSRRISSLKYFDAMVRQRWAQLQASGDVARAAASGRTSPKSSPERTALLRKQGYVV
jgi:hypothetical protein